MANRLSLLRFVFLMVTTELLRLLRLLPRLTALTMTVSMDSTSVAVSSCDAVDWGVADLLLASDCCAERLWNANPSKRQERRSSGCFFMDEVCFIRSTAKEAVTFSCAGIILIKCAGIISALCGRHPE